jgi:hypothetical protein
VEGSAGAVEERSWVLRARAHGGYERRARGGLVPLARDQGHLVLQRHDHRGRGEGQPLVEQLADPGGEGQLPTRPASVPAGGTIRTDHATRVQTPEERLPHTQELRCLTGGQSGGLLVVEALGAHGFRRVLKFVHCVRPHRVAQGGRPEVLLGTAISVNAQRDTSRACHPEGVIRGRRSGDGVPTITRIRGLGMSMWPDPGMRGGRMGLVE